MKESYTFLSITNYKYLNEAEEELNVMLCFREVKPALISLKLYTLSVKQQNRHVCLIKYTYYLFIRKHADLLKTLQTQIKPQVRKKSHLNNSCL